jgi:hypothetical protein
VWKVADEAGHAQQERQSDERGERAPMLSPHDESRRDREHEGGTDAECDLEGGHDGVGHARGIGVLSDRPRDERRFEPARYAERDRRDDDKRDAAGDRLRDGEAAAEQLVAGRGVLR